MNRTCDLAPAWAISLVPGWTVLPTLPSFQGAPCSSNMLLPATTWDLHIPGESFSERHHRQARAAAVCATCPLKRDCLAVACQEAAPSGVWGGYLFNPKNGSARKIPLTPRGENTTVCCRHTSNHLHESLPVAQRSFTSHRQPQENFITC